jgi:hypothetical protein
VEVILKVQCIMVQVAVEGVGKGREEETYLTLISDLCRKNKMKWQWVI